MKKFKNIFLVTLMLNILGALPLFLMPFMPAIKEELVFTQFEGMANNALAIEIWDLFNSVLAFMVGAILVVNFIGIKSKSIEAARTTALILLVLLIGFTLPDWINLFQGAGHPPFAYYGAKPSPTSPFGIRTTKCRIITRIAQSFNKK